MCFCDSRPMIQVAVTQVQWIFPTSTYLTVGLRMSLILGIEEIYREALSASKHARLG